MSHFLPDPCMGAQFQLDSEVTLLFPYINATCQDARSHDKPEYIQFVMDEIQCTLYPTEVIAAAFKNEKQAHKFAKRLIDFLNDLYEKKDSLTPNYKKVRPISVIDTYKLLPQTNCGECGYPTCLAFACAISKGQTTPDKCPGFSKPIFENVIYTVYDQGGNLAKTVVIEKDADVCKHEGNTKSDNTTPNDRTDLTDRELQVLRLVAQGATNTEISEKLAISPHTVKSHVIHIFSKLGVNDRTQAAVWATRHNII